MSWRLGLETTMRDPKAIMLNTERLVVIKDKYPKAKYHFLVLPFEKIDTIFHLKREHVELISEMSELALKVIESIGQNKQNFLVGFHAEPSMLRIHLHVVSKDFVSPCLKTITHWNSFGEKFLLTPSRIINDLETKGKVERLSDEQQFYLLYIPLMCNSCSYLPKNMPDLKQHLLTHQTLYS